MKFTTVAAVLASTSLVSARPLARRDYGSSPASLPGKPLEVQPADASQNATGSNGSQNAGLGMIGKMGKGKGKGKGKGGQQQCGSSSSSAGAAYFITNDPSGNMIVSSDIGSDGKLSFADATWAGGKGLHGKTDPNGPDGLFSQGSIKVSGSNVFAVNPGSNTVAMFAIDQAKPSSLKMVGKPQDSGGEFPMSVAISSQSGMVCALNGGAKAGVSCFSQSKGGLQPMDGSFREIPLNQTTPPAGPAGTASHVVFSEDGSKLIASVKGTPPASPGFLAAWDVNPQSGVLSKDFAKSNPAPGGLLPFSMTVIPGKNAILSTDAGAGFGIFDFGGAGGNATQGGQGNDVAKASLVKIDGQVATCWSSFSKATGNFYLTDIGTSQVTEVNVDNNLKGSVVKQYPQGNGSATIDNDVAAINGKDFLYVMSANATTINVMDLAAPGQATPVQNFNFANDAKAAGVTINPNNVQGMTVFVSKD